MYKTKELLDLNHTIAKEYLEKFEYPFSVISEIKKIILELSKKINLDEYNQVKENVWIHKTAKVFDSAYIDGPCIIGANTEVRHCAFIRGSALIGENCVVGNSCELKNVILFDNVQTPHYNYVGDSILGYKAHMGAGSITSNVRSDKQIIKIHAEEDVDTGLKKMGAILGDFVEVGCNAVLNPGSVVGRNSMIYPTSCVRGQIKEDSIFTNTGEILPRK